MTEKDFQVAVPAPAGFPGGNGTANLIWQDGVSVRTKRVQAPVRLDEERDGVALAHTEPWLKMAVFNRYGKPQRGLALVGGMDHVDGAAALTYGHDCHNLTVFGGNDRDMTVAANALRETGGGLCAAREGKVCSLIPLPLAGLMCDTPPEELLERLEVFLEQCRRMGFAHANLLTFFTVMPLAVSPEIKCTDRGLLDVANKRFLPLIELGKEEG